jgi:hypothetical protein
MIRDSKCKCKIETITVDNSSDFSNPMFISDYTQTTYKRVIYKCKYCTNNNLKQTL